MIHKILTLMSGGLLAFSIAAEPIPLHVVFTYGETGPLGKLVEQFPVGPHYNLSAVYRSQDTLKGELLQTSERKAGPDAVIVPADHMGLHALVNFSTLDQLQFNADIPERIWQAARSDGALFGVPLIQGNHLLLYYNKRLVPTPAASWEALEKQAPALLAAGVNDIVWPYYEPYYFLPFLGAFGGWPIEGGQPTLNTPAMVAALKFHERLKGRQSTANYCDYHCAAEMFRTAKVAYTINGEWEGKSFYQALGRDLGVTAIPSTDDRRMVSPFGVYVIAFPNDGLRGPKREVLLQLTRYLLSPPVQLAIWREVGAIPVEAQSLAKVQTQAEGHLKQTLALMENTRPIPADEVMSFIWDALFKGIIRHREKALDAEAAAAFMQNHAERAIRAFHRAKPQGSGEAPRD